MRLLQAAKGLFRGSKGEAKEPSIFDSGIGDWIWDLAVLALIALVIGTVSKWAYIAIFHK